MAEARSDATLMARSSGQHEPLVVSTRDLAAVLLEWIEKHDARFPNGDADIAEAHGREATFRTDGKEKWVAGISGRAYICGVTGLEPRSLWRVLTCESNTTSLSLADELLQAIERTDAWGIEVHEVPNPRWTQEHWIESMRERGCI